MKSTLMEVVWEILDVAAGVWFTIMGYRLNNMQFSHLDRILI